MTDVAARPAAAREAPRLAPAYLVFALVGFLLTTWQPRVPAFQRATGASAGELGLALACTAAGAIAALLGSSVFARRLGGGRATRVALLSLAVAVAALGTARSYAAFAIGLAAVGFAGSWADIAMNGYAARLQVAVGRPVMSRLHSGYSIGALAGAGAGALAAHLGTSPAAHLGLAALACLAVMATFVALPDLGEAPPVESPGGIRRDRAVIGLGLVAAASMLCEGAIGDWSAVYARDELHASPFAAGLPIVAFAGCMALARFGVSDRVWQRYGARTAMTSGTALAAAGVVIALADRSLVLVVAGFGLVGAGLSAVMPVVFYLAARADAVRPGRAVALVALAGYTGWLVGPVVIGLLAEPLGLRGSLLATLLAFCALLAAVAWTTTKEAA